VANKIRREIEDRSYKERMNGITGFFEETGPYYTLQDNRKEKDMKRGGKEHR
jgi:hypothetical protein